jgi:hypothetical protein
MLRATTPQTPLNNQPRRTVESDPRSNAPAIEPNPLCHICGLRPAGSREHLPGVAAANDGPVEITYVSFGVRPGGEPTGRTRIEPDGFYVRTICEHCNRRTGGNYGTAYKEFIRQFASSGRLDVGQPRTWVSLQDIQPLRVVKQMASMFLASQPQLTHARWTDLREFVRDRDKRLPAGCMRFYLYRNSSDRGRISPLTAFVSAYGRFPPALLGEIAWPPLGIVFAQAPHPFVQGMHDITEWGERFRFRDRRSFGFSVPQRQVASHWPLGFGSRREAQEWANREGIMLISSDRAGGGLPPLTRALPRKRGGPI